jgi:Spy/CpxP family protein refolding chaperone
MKAITKISLISGLLASSMALADPKPDTYTDSRGCGHGAHSKMMKDQGRFLDRMADRLKLTAEQRASIKTVMETSKPQIADKGKNAGESQGVTGTPADNEHR